jgi:hypothetical protein
LKIELSEIFDNWRDKFDHDEWYFNKSFELISNGMSPDEAFDYIPNVIEVIFSLEDDLLIWYTLYFLISLYSIAKTTEIHNELIKNWTTLDKHISNFKDSYSTPFQELKRTLRIRKIET